MGFSVWSVLSLLRDCATGKEIFFKNIKSEIRNPDPVTSPYLYLSENR